MDGTQVRVGPGRVVEPAAVRVDHRTGLVGGRLREVAHAAVALGQPDVAQRLEDDVRRGAVCETVGPRPRLALRELERKADRLVDLSVHRRAEGHFAHLARRYVDSVDPAVPGQVEVRPVGVPVPVRGDAMVVWARFLVVPVESPHQHALRPRLQVVDDEDHVPVVAVSVGQLASVRRQRGVERAAGPLAVDADLGRLEVVGLDARAALGDLPVDVLVEEDAALRVLVEVRDRLESRSRRNLLARAEEVEAVRGHAPVLLQRRGVDGPPVGRPGSLHDRQRHLRDVLRRVNGGRVARSAMQNPHVLAPAPVRGDRDPRAIRAVARKAVPRAPAGKRHGVAPLDRHLVDVPEQLERDVPPVRRDIETDPRAFRRGESERGGGRSPRFLDTPLVGVLRDGQGGEGGDQGEGKYGSCSWHDGLQCCRTRFS